MELKRKLKLSRFRGHSAAILKARAVRGVAPVHYRLVAGRGAQEHPADRGGLVDSDAEIEGMRQRLQQAVVVGDWDDHITRIRLAKLFDKEMPALEVIVFDDTGFPKKGSKSVGVTRQRSLNWVNPRIGVNLIRWAALQCGTDGSQARGFGAALRTVTSYLHCLAYRLRLLYSPTKGIR